MVFYLLVQAIYKNIKNINTVILEVLHMGDIQEFNYYYGEEAGQFSFFRIPRQLIKDQRFKGLSNDAKLLYGLMLDLSLIHI